MANTPLHDAVKAHPPNEGLVRQILHEHPEYLCEKDDDGWTPVHHAALNTDRLNCLRIMLTVSTNAINLRDNGDCTPLHIAAYYNSEPICGVLLQFGARIDIRNYRNATPVEAAFLYPALQGFINENARSAPIDASDGEEMETEYRRLTATDEEIARSLRTRKS